MDENWLYQHIGDTWMQWTGITALFFGGVALMLICMTIVEIVYPTVERRGFLPLTTTRGDRLFIGLLSTAYIHLFWVGVFPADWPLWGATILGFVWIAVLLRWG